MAKTVYFITGNPNKALEVSSLVPPSLAGRLIIENRSLPEDLPEIQGTPEEVSLYKARCASAALGGAAVLVDDTSLQCRALGGMPGVYIKSFLEAMGVENLHKLLAGYEDKSTHAVVTIGYCCGDDAWVVRGETLGNLVPRRGPDQFGWDPAFEFAEAGCGHDELLGLTYAEMGREPKNKVSHRARAIEAFISRWMAENPE